MIHGSFDRSRNAQWPKLLPLLTTEFQASQSAVGVSDELLFAFALIAPTLKKLFLSETFKLF